MITKFIKKYDLIVICLLLIVTVVTNRVLGSYDNHISTSILNSSFSTGSLTFNFEDMKYPIMDDDLLKVSLSLKEQVSSGYTFALTPSHKDIMSITDKHCKSESGDEVLVIKKRDGYYSFTTVKKMSGIECTFNIRTFFVINNPIYKLTLTSPLYAPLTVDWTKDMYQGEVRVDIVNNEPISSYVTTSTLTLDVNMKSQSIAGKFVFFEFELQFNQMFLPLLNNRNMVDFNMFSLFFGDCVDLSNRSVARFHIQSNIDLPETIIAFQIIPVIVEILDNSYTHSLTRLHCTTNLRHPLSEYIDIRLITQYGENQFVSDVGSVSGKDNSDSNMSTSTIGTASIGSVSESESESGSGSGSGKDSMSVIGNEIVSLKEPHFSTTNVATFTGVRSSGVFNRLLSGNLINNVSVFRKSTNISNTNTNTNTNINTKTNTDLNTQNQVTSVTTSSNEKVPVLPYYQSNYGRLIMTPITRRIPIIPLSDMIRVTGEVFAKGIFTRIAINAFSENICILLQGMKNTNRQREYFQDTLNTNYSESIYDHDADVWTVKIKALYQVVFYTSYQSDVSQLRWDFCENTSSKLKYPVKLLSNPDFVMEDRLDSFPLGKLHVYTNNPMTRYSPIFVELESIICVGSCSISFAIPYNYENNLNVLSVCEAYSSSNRNEIKENRKLFFKGYLSVDVQFSTMEKNNNLRLTYMNLYQYNLVVCRIYNTYGEFEKIEDYSILHPEMVINDQVFLIDKFNGVEFNFYDFNDIKPTSDDFSTVNSDSSKPISREFSTVSKNNSKPTLPDFSNTYVDESNLNKKATDISTFDAMETTDTSTFNTNTNNLISNTMETIDDIDDRDRDDKDGRDIDDKNIDKIVDRDGKDDFTLVSNENTISTTNLEDTKINFEIKPLNGAKKTYFLHLLNIPLTVEHETQVLAFNIHVSLNNDNSKYPIDKLYMDTESMGYLSTTIKYDKKGLVYTIFVKVIDHPYVKQAIEEGKTVLPLSFRLIASSHYSFSELSQASFELSNDVPSTILFPIQFPKYHPPILGEVRRKHGEGSYVTTQDALMRRYLSKPESVNFATIEITLKTQYPLSYISLSYFDNNYQNLYFQQPFIDFITDFKITSSNDNNARFTYMMAMGKVDIMIENSCQKEDFTLNTDIEYTISLTSLINIPLFYISYLSSDNIHIEFSIEGLTGVAYVVGLPEVMGYNYTMDSSHLDLFLLEPSQNEVSELTLENKPSHWLNEHLEYEPLQNEINKLNSRIHRIVDVVRGVDGSGSDSVDGSDSDSVDGSDSDGVLLSNTGAGFRTGIWNNGLLSKLITSRLITSKIHQKLHQNSTTKYTNTSTGLQLAGIDINTEHTPSKNTQITGINNNIGLLADDKINISFEVSLLDAWKEHYYTNQVITLDGKDFNIFGVENTAQKVEDKNIAYQYKKKQLLTINRLLPTLTSIPLDIICTENYKRIPLNTEPTVFLPDFSHISTIYRHNHVEEGKNTTISKFSKSIEISFSGYIFSQVATLHVNFAELPIKMNGCTQNNQNTPVTGVNTFNPKVTILKNVDSKNVNIFDYQSFIIICQFTHLSTSELREGRYTGVLTAVLDSPTLGQSTVTSVTEGFQIVSDNTNTNGKDNDKSEQIVINSLFTIRDTPSTGPNEEDIATLLDRYLKSKDDIIGGDKNKVFIDTIHTYPVKNGKHDTDVDIVIASETDEDLDLSLQDVKDINDKFITDLNDVKDSWDVTVSPPTYGVEVDECKNKCGVGCRLCGNGVSCKEDADCLQHYCDLKTHKCTTPPDDTNGGDGDGGDGGGDGGNGEGGENNNSSFSLNAYGSGLFLFHCFFVISFFFTIVLHISTCIQ